MKELPPIHLWGYDGPLVPLRGGHRNCGFKCQTAAWAVVFKKTTRSEAALEWLIPVIAVAEESGFAVPKLLRSRIGRFGVDGWTCETFVPGRHVEREEMTTLRPMLEKFHRDTETRPQRPGFLGSGDLLSRRAGGDVDLDSMPCGVVRRCRAAWERLRGERTAAIHGDLNPSNVLRCPDGRIGLVDWDESRVDVPAFDMGQVVPETPDVALALLAWEVACSWHTEPEYARRLSAQLARRSRD